MVIKPTPAHILVNHHFKREKLGKAKNKT